MDRSGPIQQLLILTESPLSRRDYDRFGVELLSRRFKVSVLDCTAWLKPDFAAKYADTTFRCKEYASVEGADALARRLGDAVDAIAIDYLGDSPTCASIRRDLAARGIMRAVVHNGALPIPSESFSGRIGRILRTRTAATLVRILISRIVRRLRPDAPPDIALRSGTVGAADATGARHVIWAHTFDFDTYLAMDAPSGRVTPYAVFLDEDMCYHSDYEHSRIKPPATPDAYFPTMNALFDKLEHILGLPVVISAHPRARYDLHPGVWGSRKVVAGKSAELVRDATLVICHQTTSMSFAVLWRKPLLFVTTDQILPTYLEPHIALRSELLRAPKVNADAGAGAAFPGRDELLRVDTAAYEAYEEGYIKRRGTARQPAWQVFADYVTEHLRSGRHEDRMTVTTRR